LNSALFLTQILESLWSAKDKMMEGVSGKSSLSSKFERMKPPRAATRIDKNVFSIAKYHNKTTKIASFAVFARTLKRFLQRGS